MNNNKEEIKNNCTRDSSRKSILAVPILDCDSDNTFDDTGN
jgi:hypothetical protein